jgi:hypothetical protein
LKILSKGSHCLKGKPLEFLEFWPHRLNFWLSHCCVSEFSVFCCVWLEACSNNHHARGSTKCMNDYFKICILVHTRMHVRTHTLSFSFSLHTLQNLKFEISDLPNFKEVRDWNNYRTTLKCMLWCGKRVLLDDNACGRVVMLQLMRFWYAGLLILAGFPSVYKYNEIYICTHISNICKILRLLDLLNMIIV